MCRLLSTRSIRHLLFLGLLLSSFQRAMSASDEPDFTKEQRLHNTYQNFNLKPTSPNAWRGAVSGKSRNYQIQEADTLWEMSEVLFGDPEFWPKIWSLNSEKIENPHEIFPGQTLKFSAGTLTEPPSLAVTQVGEKVEEPESPSPLMAAAQEANAARGETSEEKTPPLTVDPKNQELMNLATIPPEPPRRPVGEFPNSIPAWSFGKRGAALQFEVVKIPRNFAPADEYLSYYITEESPATIGTVLEAEMGQGSVSEFQYVSVKLDAGSSEKNLLVLQEQEEIKDPFTKEIAKIIQVQGEIEVLEIVNTDENIYRGIVKKMINPIKIGALLSAGSMQKFNGRPSTMSSGLARVIGGPNAADRRMIEPASLIYLSGTGLSEGQSYPIYKQQVLRQSKTKSFENPLKIGAVKVVRAAGNFATGVVVEEHEEIHVGDVTDPHMRAK